jgi:hypothetical protein
LSLRSRRSREKQSVHAYVVFAIPTQSGEAIRPLLPKSTPLNYYLLTTRIVAKEKTNLA